MESVFGFRRKAFWEKEIKRAAAPKRLAVQPRPNGAEQMPFVTRPHASFVTLTQTVELNHFRIDRGELTASQPKDIGNLGLQARLARFIEGRFTLMGTPIINSFRQKQYGQQPALFIVG